MQVHICHLPNKFIAGIFIELTFFRYFTTKKPEWRLQRFSDEYPQLFEYILIVEIEKGVCTYVCTYVCAPQLVCVYVSVCSPTCMCVHTYVCAPQLVCVYIRMCVLPNLYVCTYVCAPQLVCVYLVWMLRDR